MNQRHEELKLRTSPKALAIPKAGKKLKLIERAVYAAGMIISASEGYR